jgi:prolyl oligopeptidase
MLVALSCLAGAAEENDPYLWLEEIEGEEAIAWVKEQNRRCISELEAVREFEPIFQRSLEILDSQARIPYPAMRGDLVYNFWQDESHPRGIWRRATLASYRTEEPQWETVLDLDALVAADDVPWVWKGSTCLPPEDRHCMLALSRGGGDAVVYREFDTRTKAFVEGGFALPEAKSNLSWRDENSLWVGTDFGPGSLTESGYARVAKLWTRGTPLAAAATVFEGLPADVGAYAYSQHTPDGRYDIVSRFPSFFRHETFLVLGDRIVKLDLQEDSKIEGFFKDHLLVSLRSDWDVGGTTYRAGSLLGVGLDAFLRGERGFEVLFEPSERISLEEVNTTRDDLLLSILDNVRGKLYALTPADGAWKRGELPLPGLGAAAIKAANSWQDFFFYSYNDFLTPTSLYLVEGGRAKKVKTTPDFFSPEGMKVVQYEATSKDGTRIPYFVVTPKGFKADGKAPTLLYGYGGFEVIESPSYSATKGAGWLERGGVYALANIRGGGEFGPRWHQAALKEKRIKSFEDFIAVAEDLAARKITSPRHLGIMGGSQGGLLVAGVFTLRPEIARAVVSQVPLADMRRYHTLLAGASWMSEYGNPDVPEEWAYIKTWSPYHLLRKDAKYPKVFFWTNTRDDRVHPAHARKMVARMLEFGHPVCYFENIEGGHATGAVNRQRAYTIALEYAYLWKMLR